MAFQRFRRSLLVDEYLAHGLPSPVEGMMILNRKAAEVGVVANLSIMTDQTPPEVVRKAAAEQAMKGGYVKNNLALRERISEFYAQHRGARFDPQTEACITTGSQLGLDGSLRLLVDPGDEVVVGSPEYATYEPMIHFYGGTARVVPLQFVDGSWAFDAHAFRQAITPKTKLVIISNPNNPSGHIYRRDAIQEIVEIVEQHKCWLISDEIWSLLLLTSQPEFTCLASYESIRDRTVTLFSPSKTFGMSGYRTGAVMGPPDFIDAMGQMVRFSVQAAPTVGQAAFLKALDLEETGQWLDCRIEELKRRAQATVERMKACKVMECAEPESGVFLFPSIAKSGLTSLEFALRLVESKGVLVLPGYCFGRNSDQFVRISLSVPEGDYQRGFELLLEFAEELEASQSCESVK
jgi:aminotransferase